MAADAAPLAGRGAVVTGASRGIGLAVARMLAEHGVRVVMTARGAASLEAAAAAIGGHAVTADVADATSVGALAAATREHLDGAPDIVVNAACAFELAPLSEAEPARFERMIAVNLTGPFLVIRAFLPAMLERGSGHVLTLGSIAGRQAFPMNGAYSASKFGVRGLHAVLDAELRGTGVRSSFIEPAATDTSLWDAIDRESNPGLPPRDEMLSAPAVADAVMYALTRAPGVGVRSIILERA
jgi:NADP-dependent 3-hydroxy acid dehydrogenase YdfG